MCAAPTLKLPRGLSLHGSQVLVRQRLLRAAAPRGVEGQQPAQEVHRWFARAAKTPAATEHAGVDYRPGAPDFAAHEVYILYIVY